MRRKTLGRIPKEVYESNKETIRTLRKSRKLEELSQFIEPLESQKK